MENTTENGVDLSDSTVISETAEVDESAVMSSPEIHSTPNVGQDDKNRNINNTNEKDNTEDSGIQATPTSTKYNKVNDDLMSIMLNQLEKMNNKLFEKMNNKLDSRFDEIETKFNVMNSRFDNNDIKLNKFDAKFDSLKFDIDEVKTKCENSCNELKQDIERIVESVGEQSKSKNNNDSKKLTSDDNNVENENIIKNVVLESKVTIVNNDIESDNVIERVVSENNTLEVDSEIVSERESAICSNEVVISVDELEKEWKNNIVVEWGQRVNFPLICDEPECSEVLFLGKRPLLVKDLSCLFLLNNFVPSAWNDKSVIWCYDDERCFERESCIDREIELYKLMRDYNELKEMLVDMKYLPVQIESEDCFDDTCLNNNNLLYEEKITDLIRDIITNGDWTETNNVDLFYEYLSMMNEISWYGYNTQNSHLCGNTIERCYVKPRLICDDGG